MEVFCSDLKHNSEKSKLSFDKLDILHKQTFYDMACKVLSSNTDAEGKKLSELVLRFCREDPQLRSYKSEYILRREVEEREGISLIDAIDRDDNLKIVKICLQLPFEAISKNVVKQKIVGALREFFVMLKNKTFPAPTRITTIEQDDIKKRLGIELDCKIQTIKLLNLNIPLVYKQYPGGIYIEHYNAWAFPDLAIKADDSDYLEDVDVLGMIFAKTKSRASKKVYEKEYQRCETPEDGDPTRIFYETLYEENENSELAIAWLVHRGCYDEDEPDGQLLLDRYKELSRTAKTINVPCRK